MATSAKRVLASKPERPLKTLKPTRAIKPVERNTTAAAAESEPFLRFHHSVALRKKTLVLLDTIEQAEDATLHRDALSALVVELTNSGLDAFFMKPLRHARAGFVVEQSAKLGLAGVQQVMGSVARQIIGRMNGPQMISVSGSIRQFMR